MATNELGWAKGPKGKSFRVKWDPADQVVYVNSYGWKRIGKSATAGEAMRRAEAWVSNK